MKYSLTPQKFLTAQEHAHLLSTLERFKEKDFRNTTLLWLLLHTAARCSEVLALQKRDIYPETAEIFLHGLKSSDDRTLPLPPWLFSRLIELSQDLGPDDRVFSFTYNRLRQIWHAYRPCKKRVHSLRHTRALGLYESTKDLRLVQMVLGHRSIQTTMIYLEHTYKTAQLRQMLCEA